jgi:uncharacterized repeat protein (TIGR03803 family)
MTKLSAWKMAGTVFVLCVATAIAAPAQTFTSLAAFGGSDGVGPLYVSLIQGTDGNFYGTTLYGGSSIFTNNCNLYYQGCGAVFKLTPAGTLTAIYSFCSEDCRDGAFPQAGLVLAANGYLYGTTAGGGSADGGVAFRLTLNGALTTLYNFCYQGCSGPSAPQAPLLQGIDGYFYGTTLYGGGTSCERLGCGTLFEMTPEGSVTKMYRLCTKSTCPNGYWPQAGLVQGADGNFYGTTSEGGTNGGGTVFKITPHGGLTTLYNFCSQPSCSDGRSPYAGLIQATDGNFYGTTSFGGNNNTNCNGASCGTIFRITATGTLTTLYTFCAQTNCTDGSILPLV